MGTLVMTREAFLEFVKKAIPEEAIVLVGTDFIEASSPSKRNPYFRIKYAISKGAILGEGITPLLPRNVLGGKAFISVAIIALPKKYVPPKYRKPPLEEALK